MRHTPHSLHFRGVRVGILQGHQGEAGGPFATVTDYFWREDSPWLVLQLPDGQRAVAPVGWTDLTGDPVPTAAERPRLDGAALLEMARACDRLRRSPRARTKTR